MTIQQNVRCINNKIKVNNDAVKALININLDLIQCDGYIRSIQCGETTLDVSHILNPIIGRINNLISGISGITKDLMQHGLLEVQH